VLTAGSYVAGLRWGVTGVAIAYAVAIGLLTYPAFAIPFRLIRLPLSRFVRGLLPYIVGTAIMVGAIVLLKMLLRTTGAQPYLVLILGVLTGVIVFFVAMRVFKVAALSDVAEFFLFRGSAEKPAAMTSVGK
jgi:PST family polysaccharide transporter